MSLITERRILGGKKPRLPIEYQEVEWIETNGGTSVKIQTPIKLFRKIETEREFVSKWAYDSLLYNFASNGGSPVYISNDSAMSGTHLIDYTVEQIGTFKKWIASFNYSGARYQEDNLALFHFNAAIGADCKYKYIKLFGVNDTLLFDFVPCYRKSDSLIGFYDLCGNLSQVTNTPFFLSNYTSFKSKGADVK